MDAWKHRCIPHQFALSLMLMIVTFLVQGWASITFNPSTNSCGPHVIGQFYDHPRQLQSEALGFHI